MDTSNEENHPAKNHLLFVDVWRMYRPRVDMIAPLAHVSEEVIYAMIRNDPVTKTEATSVLATLSRVLKQEYTLETVHVSLLEEGEQDATAERGQQ